MSFPPTSDMQFPVPKNCFSFSNKRQFTEYTLLKPVSLLRCFPLEAKLSISHTCWQQQKKNDTQAAKICFNEGMSAQFLPLEKRRLKVSQESISIQYLTLLNTILSASLEGPRLVLRATFSKWLSTLSLKSWNTQRLLTIFRQQES